MDTKILKVLAKVINKKTGRDMIDEGRVKQIDSTDNAVTIRYDREGLDPYEKKALESEMRKELSSLYNDDCITLLSISKDSKDVYQKYAQDHEHDHSTGSSCSTSKPAGLTAGHGPAMPQKKRISGVKKVFAISSAKGGVGKSTVSTNLAIAMAQEGKKVGLLDADIYGPSIPMMMGKREAQPLGDTNNKIIPIEAHGVKFMSFGFFVPEGEAVIWRGPMLGGILNQFLFDVNWGELDYLIIDLPPGTGDMQLSLVQTLDFDGAITVSTPQQVALLDSKKGMAMFEKVSVPVLGMIENMSSFICEHGTEYHIFGKGGVEAATKELKIPYLGQIPIEMELGEGADVGTPYMSNQSYEGRPVWKAFKSIAQGISKSL